MNDKAKRHTSLTPRIANTSTCMGMPTGKGQRKRTRGGTSGPDGACAEGGKKQLPLQRHVTNQAEPDKVPSILDEVLRLLGQPIEFAKRPLVKLRSGYHFAQVRMNADAQVAEPFRAAGVRVDTYALASGFGSYGALVEICARKGVARLTRWLVQHANGFIDSVMRGLTNAI